MFIFYVDRFHNDKKKEEEKKRRNHESPAEDARELWNNKKYVFGVYTGFLAQSSSNTWNFLSDPVKWGLLAYL